MTEIRWRELGFSSPRSFERRAGGSEALVERIDLYGTLQGHKGCVNTVSFGASGDVLVSGSDDKQVMLWDWATKRQILAYPSGHSDNVFHAGIMPFTDDRTVVTTAADGQVRVGHIKDCGQVDTKQLGKHRGRSHKLASEPGSPYVFYSCGEDGVVQKFDLRSSSATNLFSCPSFSEKKRSVSLNSIAMNPRNPNYFAVGGSDEYARVYDIRNCLLQEEACGVARPVLAYCPPHLVGSKNVHITAVSYSNSSELLVSYNDELIYLFDRGTGIDTSSRPFPVNKSQGGDRPQAYSGHRSSRTVKGVAFFGADDEFVVSGSDCGHVFIWKKKGGRLVRMMKGDKLIVNCVEPHPRLPYLATSGLDSSAKLWAPIAAYPDPLPQNADKVMEANRRSRENNARIAMSPDVFMHLLRLRRRQRVPSAFERRASSSDNRSEDEAVVSGFGGEGPAAADASQGDLYADPRECNIG